jgi:RNA polymerase-binding transcription factor DksA
MINRKQIPTHVRQARDRSAAQPPRLPLSDRAVRGVLRQLRDRERELQATFAVEQDRLRTEGLAQLEGIVGDDADRAFIRTQLGLERGLIDRCVGQLADIARARERILHGEFGNCIECGEPIERARLIASPTASRCADCQARIEHALRITRTAR